MSNPGEVHWKQLKHLIRFMAGTKDWCLTFSMAGDEAKGLALKGYSDSSFGDCPDTGRSTIAYVFMFHGAPLSWYSKLNGFVTLNTNHSEYAALAAAAREAEWLLLLLRDLDKDSALAPVPISVDNSGVVSLVFNPVDHQTNKHVKLSCHYARELTEAKVILPKKVASEDNLADLFTKPLPLPAFRQLAGQLLSPPLTSERALVLHSRNCYDSEDTDSDSDANRYYRQVREFNDIDLTIEYSSYAGIDPGCVLWYQMKPTWFWGTPSFEGGCWF